MRYTTAFKVLWCDHSAYYATHTHVTLLLFIVIYVMHQSTNPFVKKQKKKKIDLKSCSLPDGLLNLYLIKYTATHTHAYIYISMLLNFFPPPGDSSSSPLSTFFLIHSYRSGVYLVPPIRPSSNSLR